MLTFHGSEEIKAKYLFRLSEHARLDQIVQGYGYWKNGKGCAIGCTLHSQNHNAYETELGIPASLAHLEDALFEALPVTAAREWPMRFLSTVPVGADLAGAMVAERFVHWLLQTSIGIVDDAEINRLLRDCVDIYDDWISGGEARAARAVPAARADLAARADRADLAALAALAARADRAALAALADLVARAARAVGAARAVEQADKLIELLASAAPPSAAPDDSVTPLPVAAHSMAGQVPGRR